MKLKELRNQKRKTQEEVANDLSIRKQTYQNYELEKRQPDILMLIKLADYFHTTIDFLVGHEVPYLINKSMFSDVQLEILEETQKLNNEQSLRVLSYIEGLKSNKK